MQVQESMFESNLSDWYRTAGVHPDEEKIPKRIAAIKGFEANAREVVSLVKFFYGTRDTSADFIGKFRSVFREHDSVFSNQGNEAELAVLAGAKLVQLMYANSPGVSELATLATASAAGQGLQGNPPVPQIVEIAFKQLSEQSKARGQVFAERQASVPSNEPAGAESAANPEFRKQFAKMKSEIRIVTEESNLLWWLFAGHSRDENRRWEVLPFPASVLKIGKELSDLTEIIPGPPSAMAFLDRVCRIANSKLPETIGLKAAIDGLEPAWKKSFCGKSFVQELEHLTPVSNAIHFSIVGSSETNWGPMFLGAARIDPESTLAPQKLAFQIFLEGMLVRVLNQTQSLNDAKPAIERS
jgi:hypothetical protein